MEHVSRYVPIELADSLCLLLTTWGRYTKSTMYSVDRIYFGTNKEQDSVLLPVRGSGLLRMSVYVHLKTSERSLFRDPEYTVRFLKSNNSMFYQVLYLLL